MPVYSEGGGGGEEQVRATTQFALPSLGSEVWVRGRTEEGAELVPLSRLSPLPGWLNP